MISCTRLSIGLGGKVVVNAATLSFAPGRVTAIIGPNGAGKTSLIRALAGLLPPLSGSVTLDGADIARLAVSERARRIGYLPQNGTPAWNVTARELVSLGRLPFRSAFAAASREDDAAVDAAMAVTDTAHLAARTVERMSGGERARVKIARVMAGTPSWILADEPLANLDPPHQRDILALFRASAAAGTGVILVLHQLNAAARVADAVVLLRDGGVVATGPTRNALTAQTLEATFGMTFRITRDGDRIIVLPSD
jgi:iron complex transport system ATP-binding protein